VRTALPILALLFSAAAHGASELRTKSDAVVLALKQHDFAVVAAYTHATKRLRFTPYAYMSASDRIFGRTAVAGLWSSSTVRTWGSYDGTGDPITGTFQHYYGEFVYDMDYFAAPTVSENVRVKSGNSRSNWASVYPGRQFVEYHFPGTDEYEGMDWKTLVFVWVPTTGGLRLVAVVRDQWTI
jgi:hypothetical protein